MGRVLEVWEMGAVVVCTIEIARPAEVGVDDDLCKGAGQGSACAGY